MTWLSRLLIASWLLGVLPAVSAADLAGQRTAFKQAWAVAEQGDLVKLAPYLNELADYPLYPYLRFAYLDNTLATQSPGAVQAFLKQQAQLPVAGRLRQDWLQSLAEHGEWSTFLKNYQNESAPALRCGAVSAHLMTDKPVERDWVTAAQHLWLAPQSQPAACGPAFEYLKQHHRITNDMVTQRIAGALQARHYALARELVPQLDAVDRPWARIWLQMAADPAQILSSMQVPDEPKYQMILLDGVQLVARSDPALARHLWHELSHRYQFAPDDARAIQVQLALAYAQSHLPEAADLLQQVKNSSNPLVAEWRVRTALRNGAWDRVLDLLPQLGPLAAKPEWRYWRARALAATDQTSAADVIYKSLADGMDYYGFLAADRLHQFYAISQEPSRPKPEVMDQLGARPGFVRARELFYTELYEYADDEWRAASANLSRPARCQTGLLAAQWGWHFRAIRTLENNGCWNDLTLTYPLAFNTLLVPRTQNLQLNLSWVYGLILAESVFSPDAQSGAGALGLMQLMPVTGRQVAAQLGLVLDGEAALLQPDTNLTLGSAYLVDMQRRFDGSEPLATAAYNAGPKRVHAWLPRNDSLPMDVWVDTIPFWQTRTYVRRVLGNAVIFDWRMHGDPKRLSARLGKLPAPSAASAGSPAADEATAAPAAMTNPPSPP